MEKLHRCSPLIRAVNFHNTPEMRLAEYERQLERYSSCFASVNEHDLEQYVKTGRWHKSKPGLIVALYNGYRNNYDVFLPLLEKYELTGWFFAVTGFVSTPPAEQQSFAAQHTLKTIVDEYLDGRYSLNWDELRKIDRHHVVASHTRNHALLAADDLQALTDDIIGSQQDFETHLGHRVRSFASLSGAAYGAHRDVDHLLEAARYTFIFSRLMIQRI